MQGLQVCQDTESASVTYLSLGFTLSLPFLGHLRHHRHLCDRSQSFAGTRAVLGSTAHVTELFAAPAPRRERGIA